MLNKNDVKNIKSLEHKKFRAEKGLFVAEGHKTVLELLDRFSCILLIATQNWLDSNKKISAERIEAVSADELKHASLLRNPQDVLAIFRIPKKEAKLSEIAQSNLVLALDDVQDPGNLGTIIRLADWFGIKDVFCSKATADIYNPKAVQATMGALSRVSVHYTDLKQSIKELSYDIPVYGTFLEGEIIYDARLSANGVIIMGNEGNGITPEIKQSVTHKLYIPNWPQGAPTSESLNVAIATAIVCSEFRRKKL